MPPIGDIKVVLSKEQFKTIEIPADSIQTRQVFPLDSGHRLGLGSFQGMWLTTADTDVLNLRLGCRDVNDVYHLLQSRGGAIADVPHV